VIRSLELIICGKGIPTRYVLRDGDTLHYCNEGIVDFRFIEGRKHPHLLVTQKPKKGAKK